VRRSAPWPVLATFPRWVRPRNCRPCWHRDWRPKRGPGWRCDPRSHNRLSRGPRRRAQDDVALDSVASTFIAVGVPNCNPETRDKVRHPLTKPRISLFVACRISRTQRRVATLWGEIPGQLLKIIKRKKEALCDYKLTREREMQRRAGFTY
jgi:hypothetical protein